MGFILMYDITNEESFNSVQDWVTQIKTYSCDNAQVILVGNKCDMEDERVITTERGKQLADQLGVQFFETSAKENINIKVKEKKVDLTKKFLKNWKKSYKEIDTFSHEFLKSTFLRIFQEEIRINF